MHGRNEIARGEPGEVGGGSAGSLVASQVGAYAPAAGSSALLPITFSRFEDTSAKTVKRGSATWGEVLTMLESVKERRTKGACPLLKLATFGELRTDKGGSLRFDDNMLSVFGIEGDYDAEEVSVDEAARRLEAAGVEAFIYTSARHLVAVDGSKGGPRWRVLAPLSREYPARDRARFVAMLNDALCGILAPESFTLSQAYYFGRVAGVPYETRRIAGEPIDENLALAERYPEGKRAPAKPSKGVGTPAPDGSIDVVEVAEPVTSETLEHLRSALSTDPKTGKPWIDPNPHGEWIAVGQALKSLAKVGREDEAREMWLAWSALASSFEDGKKDPQATWESFTSDRTSFAAVFAKASRNQWPNPAKRENQTAASRRDRTDAGNAAMLARIADGSLRYVPERCAWLWWDGARWTIDTYGTHAQAAALQVAEHYHKEAEKVRKQAADESLSDDEQKRIKKVADSVEAWARQCRNKPALDRMLGIAKSDPRFVLPAAALDTDPWLMGVDNGVVDLRTGVLRPAGRDDYVTRRSPLSFDPTAKAPRWRQFIDEITGEPDGAGGIRPRKQLAEYLQKALGYALSGSTREHKMFIAVGAGANGKSAMFDLVKWVMGDYCESIAPAILMASRHDADAERPTPSARKLAGARLAISSETKDGQRLDGSLIKRLTGDGHMTARGMHENTITFAITHKLWIQTNHKPALDMMDDATRGRIHMIPFDMQWNRPGVPSRDPALPDGDKTLFEKLRAEGPGVLAWLVAGAVAYVADELTPPAEVARMTLDYFKSQDPFSQWIDSTERCDPAHGALASALLDDFRNWCGEEGFDDGGVKSKRAFADKLKARGVGKRTFTEGTRYGLRIRGDA